jgi:predicted acetyltransferase
MEIRQIAAHERVEHMFPLQAYAFFPSPWGPAEEDAYRRRMAFYRHVVSLVAIEDGEALACVGAIPMRQNVRGVVRDMAGVASVASHPAARRRGLVRELMGRLLRQMREQGCAVSALYPFRPSFYERFGFVGIPRVRTAAFAPGGVGHLLRARLPGTVQRVPGAEGFDDWRALTVRMLGQRHGFSVFPDWRVEQFRTEPPRWMAVARVDGEVAGVVPYRVDEYGGDLVAEEMLCTGPLGRALLLQFFARHADQVARVVVTIDPAEVPDLWGTDLAVVTEGRVEFPRRGGPMVRVLDVAALAGTPVGEGGAVTVQVTDELIGGRYRLESDGGRLAVGTTDTAAQATVSAAGFSGLVYGVLDPVDVVVRGFGEVEAGAVGPLRALFPRDLPFLFADF